MGNPLDKFSGKRGSVDVKIRPMPKLSDYFQRYGNADWVGKYDSAMELWRQDLQRILPTDHAIANSVTPPVQPVIQPSGSSGSGSGGTPSTPSTPSALSADLSAHIAANIVHGTMSPVVGEDDEQALERKTIGETFYRNGKFRHSIQRNEIDSGESYTIPTGFSMVVAGPFTVNVGGSITIDGALAVL